MSILLAGHDKTVQAPHATARLSIQVRQSPRGSLREPSAVMVPGAVSGGWRWLLPGRPRLFSHTGVSGVGGDLRREKRGRYVLNGQPGLGRLWPGLARCQCW